MAKGATITLIRGRNYTVLHPTDRRKGGIMFERDEAKVVEDEEIIAVCEGAFEIVVDSDDEEVEKPIFHIERGSYSKKDGKPKEGTVRQRRTTRKL